MNTLTSLNTQRQSEQMEYPQDRQMPISVEPVRVVSERVDGTYQVYLNQLHEKNRNRLMLQRKSNASVRRERLERGFNVYFNVPEPLQHRKERMMMMDQIASARDGQHPRHQRDGMKHFSNSINTTESSMKRITSAPVLQKCRLHRRKAWGEVAQPQSNNMWTMGSSSSPSSRMTTAQQSKTARQVDSQSMGDDITVNLDILENWGDDSLVGLEGIRLYIGEVQDGEVWMKRIQGNLLCGAGSIGPEITSHDLTNLSSSNKVPDSIWTTHTSHLPVRIKMCFQSPSTLISEMKNGITLRFNIQNISDKDKVKVGVKRCRIQFFLGESHSQTILIDPVKSMESTSVVFRFPQDIKFPKPGIKFENKVRTQSLSSGLDGCLDDKEEPSTWNQSQMEISDSYDNKLDSYRTTGKERTGFLDKVSNELLIASQERIRIEEDLKTHNQLEESWTSLDFFNRRHAGRLQHSELTTPRSQTPIDEEQSPAATDKLLTHRHMERGAPDGCATDLTDKEVKKSIIFCPDRPLGGDVCIPELPKGQKLTIDIINTWGDFYYVGLTGIEVYTDDGIDIARCCEINADPPDINILPGYGKDPRTVKNLIDGINWTRDDIHMWLAPFSHGKRHFIQLIIPGEAKSIAMIRIWNYNKSRVHTSRGARQLLIYLDDEPIFHGEIGRASGQESGEPEDFSETILFTTNDAILESIALNDDCMDRFAWDAADALDVFTQDITERPMTVVPEAEPSLRETPKTVGSHAKLGEVSKGADKINQLRMSDLYISTQRTSFIVMTFVETWVEHSSRVGLTGLELIDPNQHIIPIREITLENIDESTCPLVSRLMNGCNETVDTNQMWSCPFHQDSQPGLRLHIDPGQCVGGIRIWNYNDRRVDQDFGVKLVRLEDDKGRPIATSIGLNCLLVRRAPGHVDFSIGQSIIFNDTQILPDAHLTNSLTRGFVYQLQIFSTWYDRYYAGLNGLELIDSSGSPVSRDMFSIYTCPLSVNDLFPTSRPRPDVRTAEKLIDGVNDGADIAHHCWLAPLLPERLPRIFIVFNQPVPIVGLRLWNYTRTPERGVREFAVLIDDRLIYRGYLPRGDKKSSTLDDRGRNTSRRVVNGILPNCESRRVETTIPSFIVPLDRETIESLGFDSRFVLTDDHSTLGENSGAGDFPPKLVNIEPLNIKARSGSRARSTAVNQTLRPFTCVAHRIK